jgi:hypothetical protein
MTGEKQKDQSRFRQVRVLNSAGGSHGEIYISEKQKKGLRVSTYVHKILSSNEDPYIAAVEATAGDLYNFIASNPKITPKVRVITTKDSSGIRMPTAVVSKQITGYKDAKKLSIVELNQLITTRPKQFAALLVSAYVLEENDLHRGNWGIDDAGNIVKIDNDMTLFSLTCSYKGWSPHSSFSDESSLSSWPNGLYTRFEAFSHVSCDDLINFPLLTDQKPHNWPLKDFPAIEALQDNAAFVHWKYFYLTKSLLLDEAKIKHIADAHSNDSIKNNQLAKHLGERILKIKQTLLCIPEYHDFFTDFEKNTGQSLQDALFEEISIYNQEFYFKKGEKIGSKRYPDRIIDRKSFDLSFKDLEKSMLEQQQKSSLERKLDFNLRQRDSLIERIKREQQALKRLKSTPTNAHIKMLIKEKEALIATAKNKSSQLFSQSQELSKLVLLEKKLNEYDKPQSITMAGLQELVTLFTMEKNTQHVDEKTRQHYQDKIAQIANELMDEAIDAYPTSDNNQMASLFEVKKIIDGVAKMNILTADSVASKEKRVDCLAKNLFKDIVNDPLWDKKGIGFFKHKTPHHINAIRTIINGGHGDFEKIKKQALHALEKKHPIFRKKSVHSFYQLISQTNDYGEMIAALDKIDNNHSSLKIALRELATDSDNTVNWQHDLN